MWIVWDNTIVSTTKEKMSSPLLGTIKTWPDRGGEWSPYLYYFDATEHSVWTPPADIVSEDSTDAYEIVDAWWALWLWLRKKSADGTTKACIFNWENGFLVPVKATFYFYMLDTTNYRFVFLCNFTNSANTGGKSTGLESDAGSWLGKHWWWAHNTNTSTFSSIGSLDIEGDWWYAYKTAFSTGVLYQAEIRIDAVTNKQRMKISGDWWATRTNTVEVADAKWQDKIAYFDGIGRGMDIHLKRVEVVEFTS